MAQSTVELQFTATPEKGDVSAILVVPEPAGCLLVLGHGASSNMRTPMMAAIADALAKEGIATFRYNFPYSENRRGRDSKDVCTATIRSAVKAAQEAAPDLPIFAGGHSFSGRMTSTAASEAPLAGVQGLVFFAFPLHPAGEAGQVFRDPDARDRRVDGAEGAAVRAVRFWIEGIDLAGAPLHVEEHA